MFKRHYKILLAVLLDLTVAVVPGWSETFYVWQSGQSGCYECGDTICFSRDQGDDPWKDREASGVASLEALEQAVDDNMGNIVVFSGGAAGITYAKTVIDDDGGIQLAGNDMTWRSVQAGDPQYGSHNGTVTFNGNGGTVSMFRISNINFIMDGFNLTGKREGESSAVMLAQQDNNLSVALKNLTFINNSNDADGAAVSSVQTTGRDVRLTIETCVFDSNSAVNGGAVDVRFLQGLEIRSCTFAHNEATPGGLGEGGALRISDLYGFASIEDSTFTENKAGKRGGAINAQDIDGDISINNSVFVNNEANPQNSSNTGEGGGVFIRDYANNGSSMRADIENCIFTGNRNLNDGISGTTGGDGGGLKVKGRDASDKLAVTITDCIFSNNVANIGGGTHIGRFADPVIIRRCIYEDNTAWHHGGAIVRGGAAGMPAGYYNKGESVTIAYSGFVGNRAGIDYDGNPDIVNSDGGAIEVYAFPRAVIYNCSFRDNACAGIESQDGDSLHVLHNADNSTDPDVTRSTVKNCVFYGSGSNNEIADDGAAQEEAFIEFSHNAFEAGESGADAGIAEGNVLLTSNPYSGNMALDAGSACIGAGTPIAGVHDQVLPAMDLAGNPVLWGPSVGAYEYFGDAVYVAAGAEGTGTENDPVSFHYYDGLLHGSQETPLAILVKGDLGDVDLSDCYGPENPVYEIKLWPGNEALIGDVTHKGSRGAIAAWWETENPSPEDPPPPPNDSGSTSSSSAGCGSGCFISSIAE